MNPLAKPFLSKLSPPQNEVVNCQKVYYNKDSKQLVLFMATAKNVPKGYEFVC